MTRAMVTTKAIKRPRPVASVQKTPVPIEALHDICRWPRFSNTPGEEYVIRKYIQTIDGIIEDGYGNFFKVVHAPEGKEFITMFSAHTDTVHKRTATQPYKLRCRGDMMTVNGGGVLGADDGTGIWIMLNLIEAKVPGLYVFHRDEEIGGLGSTHIVTHHANLFEDGKIKHCISFDRKGTTDVITHQGCSRCCSDEFAEAFADALNLGTPFSFAPDDTGSFTDSANYTDLIGECTNLAVGYYDQHTQSESQDLAFASALVNQLITIDFSQLPAKRQPGETCPDDFDYNNYPSFDYDLDAPQSDSKGLRSIKGRDDFKVISEMCQRYPGEIADMLMEQGWTSAALGSELEDVYSCDIAGDNGYSDGDTDFGDLDYPGLH